MRAKYSHILYAERMNVSQMQTPEQHTARAHVAAEVRGHLAKRNIPAYKLSEVLGSNESRGYWQRRVSGHIPFDIDDLERLAEMLGVHITDFFADHEDNTPRPGNGAGRRSIYLLDSNVGLTGFDPMTSTVETGRLAPITPIFRTAS